MNREHQSSSKKEVSKPGSQCCREAGHEEIERGEVNRLEGFGFSPCKKFELFTQKEMRTFMKFEMRQWHNVSLPEGFCDCYVSINLSAKRPGKSWAYDLRFPRRYLS